jgi:hypothetical protein
MPLEFEHLYPESRGGTTTRENLWLACTRCNDFKLDHTAGVDPETGEIGSLFNPRTQIWNEHFAWSPDGTTINGRTSVGRVTVELLKLNNDFIRATRQIWAAAGWWPPLEDRL